MTKPILRWISDRTIPQMCGVGFATVILTLVASTMVDRSTPRIRLSAGPNSTRRHAIAAYLSGQAAKNGLSIVLDPTAGSEDSLNQIKAGQIDVAIVNNGVMVPDDDDIKVLAAIQTEAVHVLVRSNLTNAGPLARIIRGKRVNLGEKGSTDWLLARDLLAFRRINLPSASQPGDFIPTEFGKDELAEKARAILRADGADKVALIKELPDCLLVVTSMPSTVVQLLVEAADYRIVPLPGARAFLSDNLQTGDTGTTVVDREFLERTEIPANTYFSTEGFPATDCETIGMRLLVVARNTVPARAIQPLMKTLFERDFAHHIRPVSPRDLATPYAIHPAAAAYLDRDKPLAVKEFMEWINKALSVFGALSAGALSLYGLLWRKKFRKPSHYFAEIRTVDRLARGVEVDPAAPTQPQALIRHLDDRLFHLRQELTAEICEGRIKGDQVIANILTLLKDARHHLRNGELDGVVGNVPLQRSNRQPLKVA